MNLVQWLNRFLGTVVDNGQCVAFFRRFIRDVWKVPAFEGVGAENGAKELYNWHDKLPTQKMNCDRITYNGKNRPRPGDAVIFDASQTNKYGHVGIYIGELPDGSFMLASQNGLKALDGKPEPSRIEQWTWDRVLGWLSPKAA